MEEGQLRNAIELIKIAREPDKQEIQATISPFKEVSKTILKEINQETKQMFDE